MEYLVGLFLALAVSASSTLIGFDRDRALYPAIMIVIASYYCLFAVMGGSGQALLFEFLAAAAFVGVSVIGFRRNLWLVAGALFAHGVFDLFHGHIVANPGVPGWWPMFCLTYDVVAAAYLAWLLKRSRVSAHAH